MKEKTSKSIERKNILIENHFFQMLLFHCFFEVIFPIKINIIFQKKKNNVRPHT
jgi:hypothetical protein